MHKELINTYVRCVPAAAAVPRKRCCHIQAAYLIKTYNIICKRILYGRPESDIGRDVKKYMVTREHQGFLPVKETHVPGGMAGGLYAFKAEFAVVQHVSVVDQPGMKGLRQILHGGIMKKYVFKILIGHTVLKSTPTAVFPAETIACAELSIVIPTHYYAAAHLLKHIGVSAVVGMQMRNEHVRILGVNVQFAHSIKQSMAALRQIEAGVDQKITAHAAVVYII